MTPPASIVDLFRNLRVLVVGDAMLDVYLHGTSSRLCQEAPVPIVDLARRIEVPGGAANTAMNLRALGADVTLLSVVGEDEEGACLSRALRQACVDTEPMVLRPTRRTLCKQRILSGSQLLVRYDQGDAGPLAADDARAIVSRLRGLYSRFDAIIVSDYDYGVLPADGVAALADLQRRMPRVLVGDSKGLHRFSGVQFTAVKPNYAQAVRLLGASPLQGPERIEQMKRLGPRLFERVAAQLVALTLDLDGALLFERGQSPLRTFSTPNPQSQAAGAGDTYVAALTLALTAGADAATAGEVAASAAEIVVAKDGTSACSADELRHKLSGPLPQETSLDWLLPRLEEHRRRGQQIVLTNGCFDILHRGHVTYLRDARALGDLLVVGLNTDDSIRRLKGSERPINTLEDRLQVLAALSCVDYVIPFDQDTPHALVWAIRPNVFVKGGDYTRERLPEAKLVEQLGGRVEILPLVRERSTTNLIQRIRTVPAAATEHASANGHAGANGHPAVNLTLPLTLNMRAS